MATTEKQKEDIRVLVKVGDLSNVQIGKKVGVSEKTVRNLIAKEGLVKSEIKDLARREITNTIIGNEIKSEKSELSTKQMEAYNETYIDLAKNIDMFNNATVKHQRLINKAQDAIGVLVEDDNDELIEHLPNLMAIGKMTETNRKQLYGVTETYKPVVEDDNDNVTPQDISTAIADGLPD